MKKHDVSVIVVTYNTEDLIAPCLSSVLQSRGVSLEATVIDNASSDRSAEVVRERFPEVRLIANLRNAGYGAANNLGIPGSSGRYFLLLNPDTVVDPDAIREMVVFMDAHPSVGLAGAMLKNPDGSPQDSVSFRYPGHRYAAKELAGLPGTIACVMGACQMVRADLFRQIGGFDEDFFLYGEDQDLCLRIRRLGFEIACAEKASVLHYGGQSERGNAPLAVWRKKAEAELLFYQKHYRPGTVIRLRRRLVLRSLWRISVLRLLRPFARDPEKSMGKYNRYRAYYAAASGDSGKRP